MPQPLDAPHTRDELERALYSLGIRENTFHLYGAHIEDAFVIDNRPAGWVVFYSERGSESIVGTYQTESDACRDLYARITADDHNYFDLVVGPALPTDADETFDRWLSSHGTDRSQLRAEDWKYDDVPWKADSPRYRRYFVRITAIRELSFAGPAD